MKEKAPGWLKKKQELLIVLGVVFLMGLLIAYGLTRQQSYLGSGEEAEAVAPDKVKLASPARTGTGEGGSEESGGGSTEPVLTYFLKPSAAEVMAMVKEVVDSELPVPREKYANLRIVWPVYFFQISEQEDGKATIHFDTSEDGFGVNVITEVDPSKYPELNSAQPYQKMWLAGVIEAIDAAGTGTIYMQTEQLRFREELPEVQRALENQEEATDK